MNSATIAPALQEKSARQLLDAAKLGDQAAFGEWYTRAQPRLQRRLRRANCNHHDAEDLAQETALRVWLSRDNWKSELDPSGYGFADRNAHQIAIAHFRKVRRRQRLLPQTDFDTATQSRPTNAPTPDTQAEQAELAERLTQSLATLPPKHRETLQRYYAQNQSLTAIAEHLGLPRHAARKTLHQALAQIKRHLAHADHASQPL